MTISEMLKAAGIEPTPELEKALTDAVTTLVEEKSNAALAEIGKGTIPKARFDEVNETRIALKAQVVALEKELTEAKGALKAGQGRDKELETLRKEAEARVRAEWKAREALLGSDVSDTIKARIDKFRGKLANPEKGGSLTLDQVRANLDVFATAEEFGGPFVEPAEGTPPADGTPPVKPATKPVASPFTSAFKGFKQ